MSLRPARLTLDPYRGLGTWVDAYDYEPAYQSPGHRPTVTPANVAAMAAAGARTLYLQASRIDSRSPDLIVDRARVRRFLAQAHAHGLRVVAWYLPKFVDLDADVRHVRALLDFRVAGAHAGASERFDGIAIDIEEITTITDAARRNARTVELSRRIRALAGNTPVGAIVLPPVAMEVINAKYWPAYPWHQILPYYDVWLPMSYWTNRLESSGYRDGFVYTDENIRRMLANLGAEPGHEPPIHPIGGIGDEATARQYKGFVRAAHQHHAIGWSIYDWATTSKSAWGYLKYPQ